MPTIEELRINFRNRRRLGSIIRQNAAELLRELNNTRPDWRRVLRLIRERAPIVIRLRF